MKYREEYREEYRQLQEQIIHLTNLEGRRQSLDTQRKELEKKVLELEVQKDAEQRDVEKLECRSLAKFFYMVTGKLQDRLDKERQESYAAAVKYDVAAAELEAVRKDMEAISRELPRLRGCRERYQEILQMHKEELKTAGLSEGQHIIELEKSMAAQECKMKEIREALAAGRIALSLAEGILSSLDSAEGYGTWDILGGGLIADMAKYSALDEAQEKVELLQIALSRFKTELVDVQIHADMQVRIEGFTAFADFFFDGLFADWTVLNKISESKSRISSTIQELKSMIKNLETLENTAGTEIKRNLEEIENITRESLQ